MAAGTINLNDDVQVDPGQIESVTLSEKGAPISGEVVTARSGVSSDLTVPDDVLIVRLNDGTELAVRGSQARTAYQSLGRVLKEQRLTFRMESNPRK